MNRADFSPISHPEITVLNVNRALLSVDGAIGRAGLGKEVGLLGSGLCGQKPWHEAPNGTVPRTRTRTVLLVFKLDKIKIIIKLERDE